MPLLPRVNLTPSFIILLLLAVVVTHAAIPTIVRQGNGGGTALGTTGGSNRGLGSHNNNNNNQDPSGTSGYMSDVECDRRCPISEDYILNTGRNCHTLSAHMLGPEFCKKVVALKPGPNAFANWSFIEYAVYHIEYYLAVVILGVILLAASCILLLCAWIRFKKRRSAYVDSSNPKRKKLQ
jgi:hypothetical protein